MTKHTDDEIYRSIRQVKLIALAAIVLLLVVMGVVIFSQGKTESFEGSARYRPPPETLDKPDASAANTSASVPASPASGQTVYIPAYSHIYYRDGRPILLTVTLSIRNTSLEHEIVITSVKYFDTAGKEIKSYLKRPLVLAALATTEFLVEQDDTTGGSGANFLVEWVSAKSVTPPIMEAVMIDTNRQQGISFARSGMVLSEIDPISETSP